MNNCSVITGHCEVVAGHNKVSDQEHIEPFAFVFFCNLIKLSLVIPTYMKFAKAYGSFGFGTTQISRLVCFVLRSLVQALVQDGR